MFGCIGQNGCEQWETGMDTIFHWRNIFMQPAKNNYSSTKSNQNGIHLFMAQI